MLTASFLAPKPIRTLRNLTRYRKSQIQDRSREAARLYKMLEDAGIKLATVATDIMGKSGRDMLKRAGLRAPPTRSCSPISPAGCLRKKIPALREALHGRFDVEHSLIVSQILAHIDFLDESIGRLCDEIEARIEPFAAQRDLVMSIPGSGSAPPRC